MRNDRRRAKRQLRNMQRAGNIAITSLYWMAYDLDQAHRRNDAYTVNRIRALMEAIARQGFVEPRDYRREGYVRIPR